jgi:hypothetical protein
MGAVLAANRIGNLQDLAGQIEGNRNSDLASAQNSRIKRLA